MSLGIVEGFFGPEWSDQARVDYATFLSTHGGSFYIYAPKRDAHLRKEWRAVWGNEYIKKLKDLSSFYRSKGLEFGLAISPFGLGNSVSELDHQELQKKFRLMQDIGIDRMGLFFDDMPITQNLASVQIEIVKLALDFFPKGLMFCPSFYSYDPILDKVFGQRPEHYVEDIGNGVPQEVDLFWTGPKVISPEISSEHLREVQTLLKRKPFLWENLYANDGPKNCKFLKLRPFTGRDEGVISECSGIAFNLMNQPYLSQVLFLSSKLVLADHMNAEDALKAAAQELCSPELALLIQNNIKTFYTEGLDKMTDESKASLIHQLQSCNEPVALEIKDWLQGKYIVGPECLTD